VNALRIVYVAGMGHCGSTLLDLLLSSHSRIASAGEALRLGRDPDPNCSCDSRTVARCAFWAAVGREFTALTGTPFAAIDLDPQSDGRFVEQNRALFEAIRRVTSRDVVVDSSKSVRRLGRLIETNTADIVPVHLQRRPEGIAFSHLRKGRGWLRAAWKHGRSVRRATELLEGRTHVRVSYEELASRPREVMQHIMTALDLPFEIEQLSWAGRERHNCGGNRMRYSSDPTIRPDERWRTLPVWIRGAVRATALVGRHTP